MLVQHRVNDGVRAHERPGMRLRRALSGFGTPHFEHHEWLACGGALIRRCQKPVGMAELLNKTADDPRVWIVGEKVQAIGNFQVSLVARTDGVRQTNLPIDAYLHHVERQPTALKRQRQLAWWHSRIRPCHAREIVRYAQVPKTIGTHDANARALHKVREQAMPP